jgi:hypothetical protein
LDEHDFVYENGQLIRFRVTPILEQMDDEQLSQFCGEWAGSGHDWLRQTELWQRAKVYQSPVTRQPNWRSEPIRPFMPTRFCDLICRAQKSRERLEPLSLGG